MIRFFDFIFSLVGIFILSPLLIILIVLGYLDTGSPFFVQKRMGKNKVPFLLFKFRSMHKDAKSLPTHLIDKSLVTKYGNFLRSSKLDELPQLLNVLMGDMSIVGPRPNLFSQEELIVERTSLDIYKFKPGITGLAQINKIDMSDPHLLANTDAHMLVNFNINSYFKYILLTALGKGFGDRIKK